MNVIRYKNAEDFLAAAGELLYQHEARNCLTIGIVERLQGDPQAYGEISPYLAVVFDGGTPLLAGTMTPPYGVLVSPLDEAPDAGIPVLAADLISGEWPLPDVHAVNPFGERFAEAWAAQSGGSYALEMAQRIYKLQEVTHPQGVSGRFLQAQPEHTEVVRSWWGAFEVEAIGTEPDPARLQRAATNRVQAGDWFLWEDEGEIVSMCLKTRPTRTGCSISGVYTPPEKRGRGYASACVAALSQRMLDAGYEFTSLFTDLANPTSNSIYMKIGYRPLADFDKYKLVR